MSYNKQERSEYIEILLLELRNVIRIIVTSSDTQDKTLNEVIKICAAKLKRNKNKTQKPSPFVLQKELCKSFSKKIVSFRDETKCENSIHFSQYSFLFTFDEV